MLAFMFITAINTKVWDKTDIILIVALLKDLPAVKPA